jgi:hypothetical protein
VLRFLSRYLHKNLITYLFYDNLIFRINVFFLKKVVLRILYRGRDSSVDVATGYGLDGPGIESRWGRDFPQSSRLPLGTTQPPIQ